MTFQVIVTSPAERQLTQFAEWWSEHRSPRQAAAWLRGFEAAIAGLADDPERLPRAREDSDCSSTVREMHYGSTRRKTHRAIFEIIGNTVFVQSVRHLSQDDLGP